MFFIESGDTEVFKTVWNKLFASNNELIYNHTLILDMTCFIHTCQLSMATDVEVFLKILFVWLLFFVDICRKKSTKGAELQFLCTQGTLWGGRVEDNKIMLTRHLHLLQSYIQAIHNIDKTDYMMYLITVHVFNAPRICWQQWSIVLNVNKQFGNLSPL